MNRAENWYDYDDGYFIETSGVGGGTAIVRDEEHEREARIKI